MEHTILTPIASLLALGTLLVALCQWLRLSPILGYLATGILAGPFGLGWLSDGPTLRTLAELGVVLLMFTVGLEFSLPRLLAAKRLVLGVGSAQVTLTTVGFGVMAWFLGLAPGAAIIMGGALAMSSTAIVLKQLGEQMELPADHGRVATGVLLFQDIAAVPFLVALPILAAGQPGLLGTIVLSLAAAGLIFGGSVLLGRRLLPPVLHWVAGTRSLELFMLTTLLLALVAAGVSALAGLSATLGSFMAGMLLGETAFRHQIEADIRPFRDLMLGLFFATIGMQLDPSTFVGSPGAVLLTVAALTVAKSTILVPLIRAFGETRIDAWRATISLAHGGEFGLLLVSRALALGLLSSAVAQPVLGGLILSMLIAPFMVRSNGAIAALFAPNGQRQARVHLEGHVAEAKSDLTEHVIVCGYGRVGQSLVSILESEGLPVVALDLDAERVRQATAEGRHVLYGNALQPGVLRAAGIDRARALAITIDDAPVATRIVSHVRTAGWQLPVLVRSTHDRDHDTLIAAGAEAFPEGLERSLAFAGQLLIMLGTPSSQVEARLNSIRAQEYAPLRGSFQDSEASSREACDHPEQVRLVVVEERHHAVGRTPQELGLSQCHVELIAVRRAAIRVPGHLLDTRLRVGDVLVLKGTSEAIEQAVARLTEGA